MSEGDGSDNREGLDSARQSVDGRSENVVHDGQAARPPHIYATLIAQAIMGTYYEKDAAVSGVSVVDKDERLMPQAMAHCLILSHAI